MLQNMTHLKTGEECDSFSERRHQLKKRSRIISRFRISGIYIVITKVKNTSDLDHSVFVSFSEELFLF